MTVLSQDNDDVDDEDLTAALERAESQGFIQLASMISCILAVAVK